MNEEAPQSDSTKQGQKTERVDELDVIGGLLVKVVKFFLTFYRKFFKSQQYS